MLKRTITWSNIITLGRFSVSRFSVSRLSLEPPKKTLKLCRLTFLKPYSESRKKSESDGARISISKTFWYGLHPIYDQRSKCGFGLLQNRSNFSERAKSVLLHAFAKNFGFVGKTDEIEEALDGELTRKQILDWFYNHRQRKGIPSRIKMRLIKWLSQFKQIKIFY